MSKRVLEWKLFLKTKLSLQATEKVKHSVSSLPGYSCVFRGNIMVKGKGALPTYWISKNINGTLSWANILNKISIL